MDHESPFSGEGWTEYRYSASSPKKSRKNDSHQHCQLSAPKQSQRTRSTEEDVTEISLDPNGSHRTLADLRTCSHWQPHHTFYRSQSRRITPRLKATTYMEIGFLHHEHNTKNLQKTCDETLRKPMVFIIKSPLSCERKRLLPKALQPKKC